MTHRFCSLSNARIPWATRKCYVSSFSSLRPLIQTRCFDVTNGPDLEVKGFVKGAQGAFKCSLSLPCEVWLRQFSRCNFFIPPQFNSKRAPLRVHIDGQNGDTIRAVPRKIELRTQSMSHLLSSVDPVLYCDSALRHQRANSRADCFIACFIGCFSVCFLLRLDHCGL